MEWWYVQEVAESQHDLEPSSQLFTVQVKLSFVLEVSSTFIQPKQSFKVSLRKNE